MDSILPSERLARYIIDKSYYRPSDKTVRHNAFMPAPDGQTSAFRISDLTDSEIWDIGARFVAQKRDKSLLGRADIIASDVLNNGLELKAAPDPHPRHANITGWPEDKSKQKLIAMKLAANAQLHLVIG